MLVWQVIYQDYEVLTKIKNITFLGILMVDDFLWHKVSEKEKDEIKKQAKSIMDSFSKKLSNIKEKIDELAIERENCEREEGNGKCLEIDKKIMFENAPNKNKDFIIAEKKT